MSAVQRVNFDSRIYPNNLSVNMCYYKLYIFLHCGHSMFSNKPVGFCKAAEDASVRWPGSEQQRSSRLSTTSSEYSRADSMEAEEEKHSRNVSKAKEMRPCSDGQIHPLQTRRFETLCEICQHDRDERLEALGSLNSKIHFEPWRWQFKYQGGSSPAQHDGLLKGTESKARDGTTWDVTTTLNNLITGSPGWMRDWKRQDARSAD